MSGHAFSSALPAESDGFTLSWSGPASDEGTALAFPSPTKGRERDIFPETLGPTGGLTAYMTDPSYRSPRLVGTRALAAPVQTPRTASRAHVANAAPSSDAAGGRSVLRQRLLEGSACRTYAGASASQGELASGGGVSRVIGASHAEAHGLNAAAAASAGMPRPASAAPAAPFVAGYALDGDAAEAARNEQPEAPAGLRPKLKLLGRLGELETHGGITAFSGASTPTPPSIPRVQGPRDEIGRLGAEDDEAVVGGRGARPARRQRRANAIRTFTTLPKYLRDKMPRGGLSRFLVDTEGLAAERLSGGPLARFREVSEIDTYGGLGGLDTAGYSLSPPKLPKSGKGARVPPSTDAIRQLLEAVTDGDRAVELASEVKEAARAASIAAGESTAAARMAAARAAAAHAAAVPAPRSAITPPHPQSARVLQHTLPFAAGASAYAAAKAAPSSKGGLADLRARLRRALPASRAAAEVLLRHRMRARDSDGDGVVRADEVLALVLGMTGDGGPTPGVPEAGSTVRDVGDLISSLTDAADAGAPPSAAPKECAEDAVHRLRGVRAEALVEWLFKEESAALAAAERAAGAAAVAAAAAAATEFEGRPIFTQTREARMLAFRASWENKHGKSAVKERELDAAEPAAGPTWTRAEPLPFKCLHLSSAPPVPSTPKE